MKWAFIAVITAASIMGRTSTAEAVQSWSPQHYLTLDCKLVEQRGKHGQGVAIDLEFDPASWDLKNVEVQQTVGNHRTNRSVRYEGVALSPHQFHQTDWAWTSTQDHSSASLTYMGSAKWIYVEKHNQSGVMNSISSTCEEVDASD